MTLHPNSAKALNLIKEKASDKEKIVFVSGNFNIVHPGHLRLLRFASECGDFLVVGVLGDNAGSNIVSESLRIESIQSISGIDHSFILYDRPELFVEQLRPSIVVKGKEHEKHFNPELEVQKKNGGKLLFGSGDISFSSMDLLRQEFQNFNLNTIIKPQDFCERHDFGIDDLLATIGEFKNLSVCVLGEMIVDEYITCDPLGMSQEDPTVVVTPVLEQKFTGGAGIVAAHAAGLGATVNFFSVVGKDHTSGFVRDKLSGYGVSSYLYEDESRPTILKQRFRANGKTLLRVSYLRQHKIDQELQLKILNDLKPLLVESDLLIFSDFNYGCLPQNLVDLIVDECKKQKVMMVADSQCSSQVGDVSRFAGMTLLTPTEREARLSIRDFDSGLVVLAELLRKKADCEHILMTLGKEGMLIHASDVKEKWLTDRLPAFNTIPKDPAGAGDSLLTCASMSLALGKNIWQAAYLGSIAAACQTGRLGNVPLTSRDLTLELKS